MVVVRVETVPRCRLVLRLAGTKMVVSTYGLINRPSGSQIVNLYFITSFCFLFVFLQQTNNLADFNAGLLACSLLRYH
jgi:hypothetical protein